MEYKKYEIKDGIKLHLIKTDNFKTDLSVVFISMPLEKESITQNALLPAILKNGTNKMKTSQIINQQLDMLYGASFDCGIDKTGDNIVLKFYIESINDMYLPQNNNNLEKCLDILLNIVFDPLAVQDSFDEKYIENEKKNLEIIIESQKDDKDLYAYERCINIMYDNSGYGLSKYGSKEKLENINSKNLYEYYKKVIETAKIDIIICGSFYEENAKAIIDNNEFLNKLKPRKEPIIINHYKKEIKEIIKNPKVVEENFLVSQGKLVIGLDILPNDLEDFRFYAIIYNAIFGNGVNSKLFQIVREKEGLAYTAKSEYIVQKNNIFIRCGIECENYEQTVKLIKQLLNDMKDGKFTEEDIEKAKEFILSGIDLINEEQDSQILFKYGQELSKIELDVDAYKERIKKVTYNEIKDFSKYIQINCIYFLKNGGNNADN